MGYFKATTIHCECQHRWSFELPCRHMYQARRNLEEPVYKFGEIDKKWHKSAEREEAGATSSSSGIFKVHVLTAQAPRTGRLVPKDKAGEVQEVQQLRENEIEHTPVEEPELQLGGEESIATVVSANSTKSKTLQPGLNRIVQGQLVLVTDDNADDEFLLTANNNSPGGIMENHERDINVDLSDMMDDEDNQNLSELVSLLETEMGSQNLLNSQADQRDQCNAEEVPSTGPYCRCGVRTVRRTSRNNPNRQFWGCANYFKESHCNFHQFTKAIRKDLETALKGVKIPEAVKCKGRPQGSTKTFQRKFQAKVKDAIPSKMPPGARVTQIQRQALKEKGREERGVEIPDEDVKLNPDGTYSIESQAKSKTGRVVYTTTEDWCSCPGPIIPCKHMWKIMKMKVSGLQAAESHLQINQINVYIFPGFLGTSDIRTLRITTALLRAMNIVWLFLFRHPLDYALFNEFNFVPWCVDGIEEGAGSSSPVQTHAVVIEPNPMACTTCNIGEPSHACLKCKRKVHAIPPCSVAPAQAEEGYGKGRICKACNVGQPKKKTTTKRKIEFDGIELDGSDSLPQSQQSQTTRAGRTVQIKKPYTPTK
ncbi:hypothetical protein ONE63_009574 [Megalurothrips usitatus]|uniref:SWIM-type domain-containing protein n=1 Tax=Megalurothrips usitatus TaxID=439358 RepID=A0AAV7XSK4_9NEOP|nr:hypothetical protein ONE63_009574 [Megalurothrips usitatus]